MAGQDVFKGALGWDDWIWWSGIGGLGLLLLMLVLCCVVCVQRAKRKGREEALAAVQARERERQTQEQAQLRYAQAQQARYPAREASYKFSKPEPPQPTYNPYGHDDHSMHRNSYLANAPAPKPKTRRGSQQPPGQQPMQQDQGYEPQYYTAAGPPMPMPMAPPPPPQRLEPEELPQVAAYYGRKTQPSHEPMMSQQYQRTQQVNPNQPMIAQYRKFSNRSDHIGGASFTQPQQQQEEPNDTPFVQVSTPRGSAASTASTAYSNVPPPPMAPNGMSDRASVASSSSSMMRPGGTLRDRIDALRDGSAPAPVGDNFTRISVGSAASLTGSQSSYQAPMPPQRPPPPPPVAPIQPVPRRADVVSSPIFSDASSADNDYIETRYNINAFDDEAAFATARSTQGRGLGRNDSDGSIGVDEDGASPVTTPENRRGTATRGRTHTGDSTGSIEF